MPDNFDQINEDDLLDEDYSEDESEDTDGDEIPVPFDPSSIRISTSTLSIGQLITRIKEREIDLFDQTEAWLGEISQPYGKKICFKVTPDGDRLT